MIKKIFTSLPVILILYFLCSCTSGSRQRYIKDGVLNGGFEKGGTEIPGWVLTAHHPSPDSPGRASAEPVANLTEEPYSGKQSLHVFWDIPDTDSWNSLWTLTNSQVYPVMPGDKFTVTAWMKGKSGFRCGKVWMEVIGMSDNKIVQVGIGKDMLNARSYWLPFKAITVVPEGCNQMQVRFTGGHRTDLFLDEVKIYSGHPAPYKKIAKPPVAGTAVERVRENLNRGLFALPVENNKVYVGWRLIDSDDDSVAFNIYRVSGNGSPVLLNSSPVRVTTDFVDENPFKKGTSQYFVKTVVKGVEGEPSEKFPVNLPDDKDSCLSIKLNGNYSAIKVGVGDLDGDGEYEYVIKTPKVNYDPWAGDGRPGRGYWQPSKDTYKLEAYKPDGTMMWRYDMGWSIETGVWFSPYVVYDLDGDGCAEIALKGGEGDPRDPDGHVSAGPEYLVILNGKTGKEIARTDWIPREGYDTHESLNRNQLCVAYLDGKTPCIIAERGTYDIIALAAYSLNDGKLVEQWKWNDREEDGLSYTGQGAHCVHAVDVDDDGRDEVIIGSAVVDDNGTGLWSNNEMLTPVGGMYGYNSGSGRGHPDHCVVGELDPLHPGLEVYICYEPAMKNNGICQLDAKTGALLWGLNEKTGSCHYGLISDLDPAEPGVEIWGGEEDMSDFWMFSAQGKLLSKKENKSRLAAFWNSDLQREYWNQENNSLINLSSGMQYGVKFPSVPMAVADVIGDWREELIVAVPGELRIYTTTISAKDRRKSLMYDPVYRLDVCQESEGYPSIPAFRINPYYK
jgi:rhamnogalacturonan endolyase